MVMNKINYGTLVHPGYLYPVTYTIKQDGTKVIEQKMLPGEDLTEPQIKELVKKGWFRLN